MQAHHAKDFQTPSVKTLVYTAIGGALGTFLFFVNGSFGAVVIFCLGAFIGFALSLPSVSAGRVANGLFGMTIARNAPAFLQDDIMDAFIGDDTRKKSRRGTNSGESVDSK